MTGKSHISDLGPEEKGLLYGLPYRVGIWMSHSDNVSGEDDDKLEIKALERAISSLSKAEHITPFSQEILKETLSHKDHWEQWADHSFDILADCERAVKILTTLVSKEDRNCYKKMMVDIASRVAGAYGEFGGDWDFEQSFFEKLKEKVVRKVTGTDEDADFMNISAAEEAALHRLIKALHADELDD